MDKKALRKDLEIALSKSIIETLNKRNPLAGKQIKKKIEEVSKTVAKKFYKALKELNDINIAAKPETGATAKAKAATVKKPKPKTVKRTKK